VKKMFRLLFLQQLRLARVSGRRATEETRQTKTTENFANPANYRLAESLIEPETSGNFFLRQAKHY
jgi:hypothetical protein